ncbi:MAG: glucose-6-phosphate dehydrogenase [Bacteroidia bacterium]
MEKFKNKYRIPSARAQWWDYGWNGAYFITICTKDREWLFGEIIDGNMNFFTNGHFAHACWQEIANQFSFADLGDFIVMPNHVHGFSLLTNRMVDVIP